MRLGIDLMGSDSSPEELLSGVEDAYRHLSDKIELFIYAPKSLKLNSLPCTHRIARDVILMDDDPIYAVQNKNKSSLMLAIRDLAQHKLHAVVSGGNTGALLAASVLHVGLLPNIERPALLADIPTLYGQATILDVGANSRCKEENLLQFAKLGAAYCHAFRKVAKPQVSLLNIGREAVKGTQVHRSTYTALSQHPSPHFRFIGNLEARDIFLVPTDVVVTDGFAGNVFLKAAEGMGLMLLDLLRAGAETRTFNQFNECFNYTEYPGAFLCGLKKIVVKCHGNSTPAALAKSIQFSYDLFATKTLDKIRSRLR